MKRYALKRWVGACLLGPALTMGCSQTGSRVEERPPWVAHPYVPPKVDRPMVAQRKVEAPPVQPPMNLPAPDTLPAAPAEKKDPAQDASILQTALDNSRPSPIGEASPVRRAFVDITALPGFSHTEDYGSLTGQLQHTHKGWRLRYASVDEDDPYGGSVTLTDESRLAGLKDGEMVRVHGRMLYPEDKQIAPPYGITSIQSLEKHD